MQKLDDGGKRFETFDLVSESWRDTIEADLAGVPTELGDVLFEDTPQGRLAWEVFGGTLRYAAGLVPEIADDIVNIDHAIRWGFNWVHGPFEMLDHLGPQRVIERIRADGDELPAMLQVVADSGSTSFYRDGEYLGVDAAWHPVPG